MLFIDVFMTTCLDEPARTDADVLIVILYEIL